MRSLVLVAHNIRSTHNVGSLLRTADGLGVETVYLTGYTPYPQAPDDERLPHLSQKIDRQIAKTALGAEKSMNWQHVAEIAPLLTRLRSDGYQIVGVEQADGSTTLPDYRPSKKCAIIVGREVEGIEPEVLQLTDMVVEIPMLGAKESLNVAQAAAMALYHCRFMA